MNERPAVIAASVNCLIVAAGPPIVLVVLGILNDTAVHPAGYSYLIAGLAALPPMVIALSPLAMLTAWRTFVYAKRRLVLSESGWAGVMEAGAAGFVTAVLVLARGIIVNPREAPPYVIVYGGLALMLGLVFGAVLRTTAVVVLRLCRNVPATGGRL